MSASQFKVGDKVRVLSDALTKYNKRSNGVHASASDVCTEYDWDSAVGKEGVVVKVEDNLISVEVAEYYCGGTWRYIDEQVALVHSDGGGLE